MNMQNYESKKEEAQKALIGLKKNKNISLKPKTATHFFRKRVKQNPLDLRNFNQVIKVNTKEQYVETEGLATFFDISNETLKKGYMPAVVPEMRNITIGGTISGLGVEATSFKYGLVHENVFEIDVLTGEGKVITVSPKQNIDLFYALPNALGTLGYVLKCKMKIIPVKPFVQVTFERFTNAKALFNKMKNTCLQSDTDFIEGVIFSPNHCVLLIGRFIESASSDTIFFDVYKKPWYRYIEDKKINNVYLTIKDFLWRWDADCFWGTNQSGLIGWAFSNSFFRKTLLRGLLRSDRLLRIGHFKRFSTVGKIIETLFEGRKEQLIQDLLLDITFCADFFDWYKNRIGIYPIWLCPVKTPKANLYPLYKKYGDFVVDFGFYASKSLKKTMPDNYYNRLIENKVKEFKGVKALYSTSFYSPDEFWEAYDKGKYFNLKTKYDPDSVFPKLYEKVAGKLTK